MKPWKKIAALRAAILPSLVLLPLSSSENGRNIHSAQRMRSEVFRRVFSNSEDDKPQSVNRLKTASCRLPVKDVVRLPVTSHETESNKSSLTPLWEIATSTACTVFIQAVPVCWSVSKLGASCRLPVKDVVWHSVRAPSARPLHVAYGKSQL